LKDLLPDKDLNFENEKKVNDKETPKDDKV
jgi:hypothetical protein